MLLLGGRGLAAQTDRCKATPSTSDVRFALTVKGDRGTFQEGEIIPLVLSFSSAVKDRYRADVRNYDRSGRLGIEAYCVEPQAPDPIEAYFRGGFVGGGIGSETKIDTAPFTAEAELNEWRRLAPGHYRVYAVSYRIWRPPDAAEQTPNTRVPEVLRSNTVELDVTAADPAWQSEQVQNAVQALASATPLQDRHHPARILRFLNTQDSTRQLARFYWGLNQQQPEGWDLMFGLFGSPFRKLAIESMLAEIAVPDHAITSDFLNTLVRLQDAADPRWDPPTVDPAHPEAAQEFWAKSQAHTTALMKEATEKVVAALPGKVGSARAQTLSGLLTASGSDPEMARTIRPALIAAWKDLPPDTQSELIQYRWPLIAGPDMLPILRRLVDEPPPPDRTLLTYTREAALKHIMELDSVEGRDLILREISDRNAHPTLEIARLLAPDAFAALVKSAMERMNGNSRQALDFQLLDHYGDARALDGAKRIFEQSPAIWNCTPELLRYFLRVDPEYGARQVAASLGLRKENACYRHLLQSLGDQLPKAEGSAIQALDDPDPDLVIDALVGLRLWGTAAAEPALWERLKRFHQEWAGREDQLRATGDINSEGLRGFQLEQSLAGTIAAGAGWICPPDKLALMADLVWTAAEKRQIETWIQAWNKGPAPISPNWVPDGSLSFSVLQYAALNEEQLAKKIAQFPAGTELLWKFQEFGQISPPVTMAAQEATYARMRSIAEEHGVTLGRASLP